MSEKHKRNSPVSVFCSMLGTVILIFLILLCIPFTIPKILGGQIYTVISGSMEPEIPVGSLVYVEGMQPEDVREKEVIAFYGGRDSTAIITHRVVENRVVMGEFITKGDANADNDLNPVPYEEFIGHVKWSVPKIGGVAQALSSKEGKVAAAGMIGVGVLLYGIAALSEEKDKR